MTILTIMKMANRNLFRNKLRTFLTISAIFVGSFTLTLTNGIGDGLHEYVESQVKNLEAERVIFIRKEPPGVEEMSGDDPPEYTGELVEPQEGELPFDPSEISFTPEQARLLTKDIAGIKQITPHYRIDGEYIAVGDSKKFRVQLGMLSEGITQKTEAGRTIDGSDQVVLPLGLARAITPNINELIGKRATIAYKTAAGTMETVTPEIVGIATKGFQTNTNSFLDRTTAEHIYNSQKTGNGADKFYAFSLHMESVDEAELAKIKGRLAEKGFAAETLADQKRRTYDAIGIFRTGLNFFAFIALLAASFGIINTLIIAVMERTKEIGLQKALGLSRAKIFMLFSFESVLIGFWGAAIGIVSGIAVGTFANAYLVDRYIGSFEGFRLFAFTVPSIAFILILVAAIAFVAGVFPAFRASRLNPIESLRYE